MIKISKINRIVESELATEIACISKILYYNKIRAKDDTEIGLYKCSGIHL